MQSPYGTTYVVDAITPPDSHADVVLEVHDRCGGGPTFSQGHTISPDVRFEIAAPAPGNYYLKLAHNDLGAAEPKTYRLAVRALPASASPGALVLVAGRRKPSDNLQHNIHNVTQAVYRLFMRNGYDGARIYFLATDLSLDADRDGTPDVGAMLSVANLEYAITQWAAGKVGPGRAFTFYMVDHGSYDKFYLNGQQQTLAPDTLDGWLDALETAQPDAPVNVIIEACHSGSFIDLQKSLSKAGRIIITSIAPWVLAHASEPGRIVKV